ncbi:MAG TPA: ATP-binding protein, partial [Armatimonadota bacterium]|nr:ATP-binding protein [Armatimonadota bacterium]
DHEVEYRMIAADGRVVWLRDIVSVVREEGETRALRGFLLDITTRKLLEEQLAQSQKMEAVGRLAGGVAHDFNNMLAVINGYSELCLSMLPPESPLSPSLEEIRKAGNRASALTRQLLAFSRKQLLKMQPLDLNDVAQNMSKMLRRLIGDHIDLQYALSPSPACIKADLSQTEQVIMNLVVNARDAMPAGGTLSVAVHAEELRAAAEAVGQMAPPGRYVALSIRDTGAGMEKALIPHIFEPFFTTKPVGEGTGLGLAMVLGIVQQSGGYIQVSSRPGEGTLFRILFPALEQPQVDGSPPAAAPLPGGTETVLLVEDDEAVRGLVRTVLQMHGYTVLEAADAGDALLLCERHRDSIDLVLTDMVMPGLSGNEVVELLREYGAPFKVLYMSGYTDDAVVRRGVLTAEMELIQKPFTPDALARKVRETLDG